MFYLRVVNTGTHKKRRSKHYLLLLAVFPDLKVTHIWSIKNVFQVRKVLILDMSSILGKICIDGALL